VEGVVPLPEAQRQDVHEATLEQATDLHAAPQRWYPFAPLLPFGEAGGDGVMGRQAVVVGDRHLQKAEILGLLRQYERIEAAVAAECVAVKVELSRAALRPNGPQDRG
jgi:hypothetical protein